ncbi:hypothetical protein C8F01DRAFT_1109258 [Mycena amicta]|nr:hypothetical protein C8F01DRAFT_1109258 [Mycena amicta]
MLVSRLRLCPPQFVRAASFPPKRVRPAPSIGDLDAVVDPAFFLQLRQRIIERHTSAKLDEPHVQHFNANRFSLLNSSWEALQEAQRIHLLPRSIVEQIAQLVASPSPDAHLDAKWSPLVGEVALASAAVHATDALNACLLALLKRGESRTVLALYEEYRRPLPEVDTLVALDLSLEAPSCGPDFLLAAVAAHAMQNSFEEAVNLYISADILPQRRSVEFFVRTLSAMPELQGKVKVYLQRLDIAKSVHRSNSLCKHIHNLSTKINSRLLEELYDSIIHAMNGPEAFIAAAPHLVTGSKPIAMTEFVWASFLVAFLRRKRNDLATNVWQDMGQHGVQTGTLTWNMIMDGYSDFGTVEEVYGAWNTMLSRGVKPDGMSYRAALSEVKPTIPQDQVRIVYNSYNTVIAYHARRRDFKSMANIINQMQGRADAPDLVLSIMRKQGVRASVATYTSIINSQLAEKTIPHLQAALRLLDDMENSRDATPNEVTYTSIISGLYRGAWLPKRKIKFHAGGYNILIKACLGSEDQTGVEDALRFYQDMVRNEWEWQLAQEIVGEIQATGVQPSKEVSRLVRQIRQYSI